MGQVSVEELKARFKEQKSTIREIGEGKIAPIRANVTEEYDNYTVEANGTHNYDKHDFNSYSALIFSLKVKYGATVANGVRVRWSYSQKGADYDSAEDAEDQGNYEDLTFAANDIRHRTIIISLLTPYIRIQVYNPSGNSTITVMKCYTLSFR